MLCQTEQSCIYQCHGLSCLYQCHRLFLFIPVSSMSLFIPVSLIVYKIHQRPRGGERLAGR